MSAVPPRILGPKEARIKQLWHDTWAEYEKGGVYEPYIAIAESEIANFRASLNVSDHAMLKDFSAAENLHLFHSRHFAAAIDNQLGFREQLRQLMSWNYEQIALFNGHTVKSLTLANGGIVVASLAYIQAQHSVLSGFLWVIGLGASGYILSLIASHTVVTLSGRLLQPIFALLMPRVSKADAQKNLQLLKARGKTMVWASHPLFYLSALCLVAALCVGVTTLMQTRSTDVTGDAVHHLETGVVRNLEAGKQIQQPRPSAPPPKDGK